MYASNYGNSDNKKKTTDWKVGLKLNVKIMFNDALSFLVSTTKIFI